HSECPVRATSTTQIYTLSLHDALPIFSTSKMDLLNVTTAMNANLYRAKVSKNGCLLYPVAPSSLTVYALPQITGHPSNQSLTVRSEEHTSELQSRENLVCRLLLEKKNK